MRKSVAAPLALVGGILLAACQILVYFYAPVETVMGLVQKIFYFHLPVAWWCFVSFFTAFCAEIAYLKTRRSFWDLLGAAAVEWGMVLATLALLTGSIWARHSWGTWWTWDPRLTTMLVLWFIYAAYLIIRHMDLPEDRCGAVSAVIAIVGFLDVPLVFFSARLWRSIHPAVFAKSGGLEPEMAVAAIAMVLSFALIWLPVLILRTRQLVQNRRLDILQQEQEDEAD